MNINNQSRHQMQGFIPTQGNQPKNKFITPSTTQNDFKAIISSQVSSKTGPLSAKIGEINQDIDSFDKPGTSDIGASSYPSSNASNSNRSQLTNKEEKSGQMIPYSSSNFPQVGQAKNSNITSFEVKPASNMHNQNYSPYVGALSNLDSSNAGVGPNLQEKDLFQGKINYSPAKNYGDISESENPSNFMGSNPYDLSQHQGIIDGPQTNLDEHNLLLKKKYDSQKINYGNAPVSNSYSGKVHAGYPSSELSNSSQQVLIDANKKLKKNFKKLLSSDEMGEFSDTDLNFGILLKTLQKKVHATFLESLECVIHKYKSYDSITAIRKKFEQNYEDYKNTDSNIFNEFKNTLQEIETKKLELISNYYENQIDEKNREIENLKKFQEAYYQKNAECENLKQFKEAYYKKNTECEDLKQFQEAYYQKNTECEDLKKKISEIEEYSLHMSKGLQNLGNSCYMNSVLQILAHFDELATQEFSSGLTRKLSDLMKVMRSKTYKRSQLTNALNEFYEALLQENDDFKRGQENDPKYLLIFLHKCITDEKGQNFNLIRCTKSIIFCHSIIGWSSHQVKYPDQITNVFSITPSYSYIRKSDISDIIEKYSRNNNYWNGKVTGFCDKCRKDVQGEEKIESYNFPSYTAFCTTDSNYSCNLSELSSFKIGIYLFNLVTVVIRCGSSYAHNYSVCKEGNEWIIYNDNEVSVHNSNQLNNVYILIYKTTKSYSY